MKELREVLYNLSRDYCTIKYIDNITRMEVDSKEIAKEVDNYLVTEIRRNEMLLQYEVYIHKKEN